MTKWNHKIEVRLVSIFQECNDTSWSPAYCVPSIFSYCLPDSAVYSMIVRGKYWECIVCHPFTAMPGTRWNLQLLHIIMQNNSWHDTKTKNSNKTWYFSFSTYTNFLLCSVNWKTERRSEFLTIFQTKKRFHFSEWNFQFFQCCLVFEIVVLCHKVISAATISFLLRDMGCLSSLSIEKRF